MERAKRGGGSVPSVARFPRIRRPRLRERPINASSEPLASPEPETPETKAEPPATAPATPAAEAPTATETPAVPDAPPADLDEAPKRRLRIPRPNLPRPKMPRLRRSDRSPRPPRRRIPLFVKLAVAGAVLLAGVVVALVAFGVFGADEESPTPVGPAPTPAGGSSAESSQPPAAQAAAELGFPAFATKNTTRVGGSDPTANAAGVALAVYPSAGGAERPEAVTLVGDDDWAGGIAASALVADPVKAPILLSTPDSVPDETDQALSALAPEGGAATDGAQVFAIGDVDVPGDLQATRVGGKTPAALAAAVDRLRARLTGTKPRHVIVAPVDEPAFAMPAASWAARSGDTVLFSGKDQLPKETAAALHRHKKAHVYVLGPSDAISSDVVRQISRIAGPVRRISGEDPVTNSVEFARYSDGSFGWDINDPGHGFVVARDDRPLDAAAAAPLSASGTWGPLVLSDSTDTLPGALRGYLLDVKPGYRTNPTRAFYNHVWVIGNQDAISVSQQAAIDDLAELTKIGPQGSQ